MNSTYVYFSFIPVVEILLHLESPLPKHEIGALIITPTRELAQQISFVLKELVFNTQLTHMLVVGGKSLKEHVKNFIENGSHIIVATPGKLITLIQSDKSDFGFRKSLKSLEILILDEADRLLSNANFERDLNTIFSHLPKQRRTSLFSATQTDKIESFIRAGLRNPVQVVVREKTDSNVRRVARTPETLQNYYLVTQPENKLKYLISFLRLHRKKKIILFFNTCASVDYHSKILTIILKTIPLVSIHGQMKNKRNEIFDRFQTMHDGILICTDVMSRGIDIPKVDWVVQYDPPSSAEAFVHRCGRTARIGNIGNALIFLLPNESSYVEFVKLNQKVPLEKHEEINIDELKNLKSRIQKISSRDREIYEKGLQAFVSFIQSYKKHECSLIFQLSELNICRIADSFGLIHLPKMPELKNIDTEDFIALDIDVNEIRFQDKIREKRRLEKLEERKTKPKEQNLNFKKQTVSWSKQKEKREEKQRKREKKERKRKLKMGDNSDEDDDDLNDLMREGRLLKKLKNGKISESQFQEHYHDGLSDEENTTIQ